MPGKSPTLRDLVVVNLRYDAGMAALNVRAIAQLLAKILYTEGNKVSKSVKDLQQSAAKSLGIQAIAFGLVQDGLEFLDSLHMARESGSRWQLTDKGFASVGSDVAAAAQARTTALDRNFPPRLERAKLEEWFVDAATEFYRIYGSQWASALARRAPKSELTSSTIASILDAANKKHGLTSDSEALETGFRQFVMSDRPEDEALQWSLGQSLLASQLVAANVGPDPITAKEFHNSLLILDTNVLIEIALQEHSRVSHIGGLGKVLKQIGARVAITERTRDEYVRLIEAKRPTVLRAAASYKADVLAHSGDGFLHAALGKGCHSRDDFDEFFNELLSVPTKLSEDLSIELLDSPETEEMMAKGVADTTLQKAIAEAGAALNRRWPKSVKALQHDAALTTLVESLRAQGQNCAVLTLDRTMCAVGAARARGNENLSWLLFDGLIQILSVDGAGPGLDPSDFASLLASIIRNEIQPAMNTYTAEDLVLMLDIEDRCANLPSEKATEIATFVARERYSGTDRLDGELQLGVRQRFQAGKTKYEEELQSVKATSRGHEVQLAKHLKHDLATSAELVQVKTAQLRRAIHFRAAIKTLGGLSVATILGILGYRVAGILIEDGAVRDYVQLLGFLLAPALGLISWVVKKVIPDWRSQLAKAPAKAEAEVAALGDGKTKDTPG